MTGCHPYWGRYFDIFSHGLEHDAPANLVGGQGDEYQQDEGDEVVQRVGGVRGYAPGYEQAFDDVQCFHIFFCFLVHVFFILSR